MARIDLYSNPSSKSKAKSPCLLDVQNDPLGNLMSRVVIPLTRATGNCTPSKVAQDVAPLIDISTGRSSCWRHRSSARSGRVISAPRSAPSKQNKSGSLLHLTVCSALINQRHWPTLRARRDYPGDVFLRQTPAVENQTTDRARCSDRTIRGSSTS